MTRTLSFGPCLFSHFSLNNRNMLIPVCPLAPLTGAARAAQWLLAGLLAMLCGGGATRAQTLNYSATSTTGTYTDLGPAGTVIGIFTNARPEFDEGNSAPQSIGFPFSYNGATFTEFVLNTNGFLKLGTIPPSTNLYLPEDGGGNVSPFESLNPVDVNIVAPFNFDLREGNGPGGGEYRVATTGTAPNRVCTVQWKNVTDKGRIAAAQYPNFSFQAKLYETTNVIEFAYDAPTAGSPATPRLAMVGLKGTRFADRQVVQVTKSAATAWNAATFVATVVNYTVSPLGFRSDVGPAGVAYRFVPRVLPDNEVEVLAIYTLGKVASAVNSPVTVRAEVRNNGGRAQANVPVTLTVRGATTFTSTQTVSLPPAGATATVTFAAYPVSGTSGVNTLTVAVPADDLNTNNSQTYAQAITPNTLSYLSGTAFAGGIGLSTVRSLFFVRYQLNGPAVLAAITPTFVGNTTAGTSPTYQVRVYQVRPDGKPGASLYMSAARPRPATGGAETVPLPSVAVPADFFVAVETLSPYDIGLAFEIEAPLRTGVFFYIPVTTNGGDGTDLATTVVNARLALDVTVAAGPLATAATLGSGTLGVYPNPARDAAVLHVPAVAGARSAHVAVFNALGQIVRRADAPLPAAGTQVPLDLRGLSSGVYQVRVRAGDQVTAVRVAVE